MGGGFWPARGGTGNAARRAPVRHLPLRASEAEGALAAPRLHAGFMRFIAASARLRDCLHHNTSLRGASMKTTSPDPPLALAVTARSRFRRAGGHARRKLVAARRRRRAGRDPGPGGGSCSSCRRHRRRRRGAAAGVGAAAARWSTAASSSTAAKRAARRGRRGPADEEQADPTDFPSSSPPRWCSASAACSTRAASSRSSSRCARPATTLWLDMARQYSAEKAVDRHAAAGAADGTPVSRKTEPVVDRAVGSRLEGRGLSRRAYNPRRRVQRRSPLRDAAPRQRHTEITR